MNSSLAFAITNSVPTIYPGHLWTYDPRGTVQGRNAAGETWTVTRTAPRSYRVTGAVPGGKERSDAECQAMAEYLAEREARYDRECAESIAFHRANPGACA